MGNACDTGRCCDYKSRPNNGKQSPRSKTEKEPVKNLTGTEPEELEKIQAAACTDEFRALLANLTNSSAPEEHGVVIRGGQVDHARPFLQAPHNSLGWTLSGYSTRPTQEIIDRKTEDFKRAISDYRQLTLQYPDGTEEEDTSMYPYLCDVIFGVPSCSCEPKDLVWDNFEGPTVSFDANVYPYQFKTVATTGTKEIDSCQHWNLWYLHTPPDQEIKDPSDEEIDADVRRELANVVQNNHKKWFSLEKTARRHHKVDYVWYRNPGMSVPDLFHVQVFWKVPAEVSPVDEPAAAAEDAAAGEAPAEDHIIYFVQRYRDVEQS